VSRTEQPIRPIGSLVRHDFPLSKNKRLIMTVQIAIQEKKIEIWAALAFDKIF
jgi:hypothetical protein